MRESAVENPVVIRAEANGYYVRKVKWIGVDGAPDRVFARDDRGTVWIEFKKPGKEPRRRQANEHRDMRAAGMEVYYCDDVDEALRLLWLPPYDWMAVI